jgi:hypothetical protein
LIKKNDEAYLDRIAEEWLTDNPIKHPLGSYFKKVFIEAYNIGYKDN